MSKKLDKIHDSINKKKLEETEDLFTEDLICGLVEKASGHPVTDMFEAGEVIYDILFQGAQAREKLFKIFLDVSTDVTYDWFSKPFGQRMADKTGKKQYFTPAPASQLVSTLITSDKPDSNTRQDPTAGTGSMTVGQWEIDRKQHSPFSYKPSMYWYEATELKEEGKKSRALPFLLFNFLIRGMNGAVVAGDSLTRTVSQVFFIQNLEDEHLQFSSLNVMPRTKEIEKEFDIRKWIDEPIDYIEDTTERITEVAKQSKQKAQQQYQHEKEILDGTLNVVKQQNNNNPNAKKMKDLPKDEKDNLADNLDGILKLLGITPDPKIRKDYFGD